MEKLKTTPAEEESSQGTTEDYQDDFCIIEHIIATTGDKDEPLPFVHMYEQYLNTLQNVFSPKKDKELEPTVSVFPLKGEKDKEGLRAVLLFVLQACILMRCKKYDLEFNRFWSVYSGYLGDEPGKIGNSHIYHDVFHSLLNMAIGIQGETVSTCEMISEAAEYIRGSICI